MGDLRLLLSIMGALTRCPSYILIVQEVDHDLILLLLLHAQSQISNHFLSTTAGAGGGNSICGTICSPSILCRLLHVGSFMTEMASTCTWVLRPSVRAPNLL